MDTGGRGESGFELGVVWVRFNSTRIHRHGGTLDFHGGTKNGGEIGWGFLWPGKGAEGTTGKVGNEKAGCRCRKYKKGSDLLVFALLVPRLNL